LATPAHPDIPSVLFARLERAVKELTPRAGASADDSVDEDIRKWLDGRDGKDEPLAWGNSSGVTGRLTLHQSTLGFDVPSDEEDGSWKPIEMSLEADGLYHWRRGSGAGHWWGFLSETQTHTYLGGNYINPDGRQGVQVFIWPK
jgi:hypothetical protein